MTDTGKLYHRRSGEADIPKSDHRPLRGIEMRDEEKKEENVCQQTKCSLFFLGLVFVSIAVICVVTFTSSSVRSAVRYDASVLEWWQKTIVYQVYPRSFKDSDGDGVGDLRGITEKLDHFTYLGVGCIWINPFYPSPMKDFGYDVSNYTDVDPIFGNITDFETLMTEARRRGLKILVDFVPNHTSNESEWFIESRKGRNNTYSDYYIWDDGVLLPNGSRGPPNNWGSVFGGSAWSFDSERGQYFYHAFLDSQVDLNFRNPKVREEIKDVLRFWLDKGVSGFRLDALKFLFETEDIHSNETLVPNQFEWRDEDPHNLTTSLPEINDVIKEWRELLDEYEQRDGESRLMLEESLNLPQEVRDAHYQAGAIPFNFALVSMNNTCGGLCVKTLIDEGLDNLRDDQWPNYQVGNHDQPRVSSRVGADKMAAITMLLLTLPGTPITYYGDEIGMSDVFYTFEETQDPVGLQFGKDGYLGRSRDPERSPMQWSDTENAGFSSGIPWLRVHPDFNETNVKAQKTEQKSILNLYRRLANLRQYPAFQTNRLQHVLSNENIVSYVRESAGWKKHLVIINFGINGSTDDYSHNPVDSSSGTIVATTNNFESDEFNIGHKILLQKITLQPGQGLVVEVTYESK